MNKKKPQFITLHLIFLILLLNTCSKQNPPNNKTIDSSISNTIQPNQHKNTPPLKSGFTSMVRSIFQDSKGNFWFGSDREGVCLYDGKSVIHFSTEDGLCHNQIRTIQEDEHGHIWFATGNGVSSYDGKKFRTHTAKKLPPLKTAIAGEWKKEANDLWFNGETEGGVYRYDGQDLWLLEFPVLDSEHESFSIKGTVPGISQGESDMIWIANYGGVIGYDGNDFSFINERGIDYHVRSILEDSQGNLWIGNNGIGVLYYDGEKTIKLFDKKEFKSSPNRNFPFHVFALAEDNDGNIWIGDRDSGAWCYDGKTLKNYRTKNGLSNIFVRVIYKDKKGQLWFGLEGGGICTFNGKSFDRMY